MAATATTNTVTVNADIGNYFTTTTLASDFTIAPTSKIDCASSISFGDVYCTMSGDNMFVNKTVWKELLGFDGKYEGKNFARYIVDSITDIKVNGNTTIVWFADGDKQVATVREGDTFDLEEGLNICLMKHIVGKSNYGKIGKMAMKKYKAMQKAEADRIAKNEAHKRKAAKNHEKKMKYKQRQLERKANAFAKAFHEYKG